MLRGNASDQVSQQIHIMPDFPGIFHLPSVGSLTRGSFWKCLVEEGVMLKCVSEMING